MIRNRYVNAAVAAVAIAGVSASVLAATRVPARETFRDALYDRIRSDHDVVYGSVYEDGIACVVAWVQGNFSFLRSVDSTCAPTSFRKVTLDFGDAVSRPAGVDCSSGEYLVDDAYNQPGALNICGANDLPDVRVIANNLFARNALKNGTPVSLYFSLSPDFSHTAFSLEFEQNAQVFADPSNANAREVEAVPTVIAELYKSGRISLGRYRMPFRLRVEKLQ